MPEVARNHHVVPQGYLAAFTNSGQKSGLLVVWDKEDNRAFTARPKRVAAVRDFNRLESSSSGPDALERQLGKFEAKALTAVRELCRPDCEPAGDRLNWVLNLVALLAVHNPYMRRAYNRARRQEVRILEDLLANNRRLYEHHVQRARERGDIDGEAPKFEQFAAEIERTERDWQIPTDENIVVELDVFKSALASVGRRAWAVLAAPAGLTFLSCDHPVCLRFLDPQRGGPIGLALPHTELLFPLGPGHCLIGTFEDQGPSKREAAPEDVASINATIADQADRHVFSKYSVVDILIAGRLERIDLRPN